MWSQMSSSAIATTAKGEPLVRHRELVRSGGGEQQSDSTYCETSDH
jgi:hypothetical protein